MPYIPSYTDRCADREAQSQGIYQQIESEVMREVDSLNIAAAALYALLSPDAEERIRADLFDLTMTAILSRTPNMQRRRSVSC